jgi:hypothetical protein
MSPDWSRTEYGHELAVDVARLRTGHGSGCGHGLTTDRTRTGCGYGLDQDKDADWTRPRSRRGCGRLSDWTRSRTGHGHGRLTGFWRGHFATKLRLLRGRKNLILMRSKACPRYKLKNLALCCDRRERHALAAARGVASFTWLAGISAGMGVMFFQSFGGTMPNHSVAWVSLTSCR